MTNKQIIIGGIDVSGCEFYNKVIGEDAYCDIDEEHLCTCTSYDNCYYKQLKRKEELLRQAENHIKDLEMANDQLEEKITEKEEVFKRVLEANHKLAEGHKTIGNDLYKEIKEYRIKLKAKEQECEELKIYIESNEQQVKEVETLVMDNDRLINELDQLKEQIKYQQNFIDNLLLATNNSEWLDKSILDDEASEIIEKIEMDYIEFEEGKEINAELKAENATYKKMFEDENVQLALTEIRSGERHLWFNKAEKYKQALTEIKKIVENGKRFAEGYMVIGEQKANVLTYANAILQKISEVIPNEN